MTRESCLCHIFLKEKKNGLQVIYPIFLSELFSYLEPSFPFSDLICDWRGKVQTHTYICTFLNERKLHKQKDFHLQENLISAIQVWEDNLQNTEMQSQMWPLPAPSPRAKFIAEFFSLGSHRVKTTGFYHIGQHPKGQKGYTSDNRHRFYYSDNLSTPLCKFHQAWISLATRIHFNKSWQFNQVR